MNHRIYPAKYVMKTNALVRVTLAVLAAIPASGLAGCVNRLFGEPPAHRYVCRFVRPLRRYPALIARAAGEPNDPARLKHVIDSLGLVDVSHRYHCGPMQILCKRNGRAFHPTSSPELAALRSITRESFGVVAVMSAGGATVLGQWCSVYLNRPESEPMLRALLADVPGVSFDRVHSSGFDYLIVDAGLATGEGIVDIANRIEASGLAFEVDIETYESPNPL